MLTAPIAVMGSLGLKFTDDFDRADSSTLGNSWIEAQGDWTITSNALRTPTTPGIGNRVVRTESVVNQAAECVPKADLIGPCVRANDTGSMNGYTARPNASNIQVLRMDAGSIVILDTFGTAINNSTDRLKIEVWGNSIRVYKNDALVGAVSDTTYGSGRTGVAVTTTSQKSVDDFKAWWN